MTPIRNHSRQSGHLVVSLFMLAVLGCSEAPTTSNRPEPAVKTLTILTPHNADIQSAFWYGFSDWYRRNYDKNTEVEINWIVRGTPKCVEYVRDLNTLAGEVRPRVTPDLLFGGGVTDHQLLAGEGWTKPVDLGDAAKDLPETIGGYPTRDPQGQWYATALARFGILYNQQVCKMRGIDPPASWSDLADPRFSGWLGIADPAGSGTTRQCFTLILQDQGWEQGWATIVRILANARALTRRSSDALDQVVVGESIAAFGINYDGQKRVADSDGRLQFVIPSTIASVSPAVVSVLKNAPEPKLAEAFVRYNLSEEGQKLWGFRSEHGSVNAPTLYHYPIIPTIYENHAAMLAMQDNPFAINLGRDVDPEKSQEELLALEPLLAALTHGQNHLLLQRAWERINAAGQPADALKQLTTPPLTESEARELGTQYRSAAPYEADQLVEEWVQKVRTQMELLTTK